MNPGLQARVALKIAPVLLFTQFLTACVPIGPGETYELLPAVDVGAAVRPDEPPPFWYGVSTASFQTEDRPTLEGLPSFLTDWDLFHALGVVKLPDDRIGSFTNYERDISALKYLGVTHYRFGVEWARVEPKKGAFDQAAIDHYVNIARRLKEEGIEPLACLWHFTFPDWLADTRDPDHHGWRHPDAEAAWKRYVEKMATSLAPHVQLFAPMNEPNAYAFGMMLGYFPGSRVFSDPYYRTLNDLQIQYFIDASGIIRDARADAKIISIQSITAWQHDTLDPFDTLYNLATDQNYSHLDGVISVVDYVGINYYQRATASPIFLLNFLNPRGDYVSDLGWIIDPEGLKEQIVEFSKRYRKPLIITENGLADHSDLKRPSYIYTHMRAIRETLDEGYDVRGYFHWSLIDNFEWLFGYEYQFGLFSVGESAASLTPKGSAGYYRDLIRARFMDADVDVSTLSPGK